MNTIDSTRRALELFRQQISRRAESSGVSDSKSATERAAGAPASAAGSPLRQSALRRLRALSPSEVAYNIKAIRVFVQSALEAGFGEAITNSTEYQEMLGVVCAQIQDDAVLAQTFKDMIGRLLSEG